MSPGIRRGALLSVLALGLAVASCMALEAMRVSDLDVNRCSSDAACAPGTGRCDQELHACVDPELLGQGLLLHVVEPNSSASSEHRLVVSEVNAAEPTLVRIAQPSLVRGLVVDAREGSTPLPSRLTFRRQVGTAGLAVEPTYAESTVEVFEDDRHEPNNFEVLLTPGAYVVDVEPTVEAAAEGPTQLHYPQRRLVEVSAGPERVTHVDFRYPAEARRIQGVVSDAADRPLGRIRIFAHEPEGGARLSNVALTGCEGPDDPACGRFELAVAPEVEVFRLRMESAETDPRLPVVDRGEYRVSDPDGDGLVDIGAVRFPAVGEPVLVSAQVVGEDRAGLRSPLPGATVVFRTDAIGDLASPAGSLEARATTDDQGYTVAEGRLAPSSGPGIWLPEAVYVVSVTPQPGTGYATAALSVTVEAAENPAGPFELMLHVGPRLLVTGTVVTPAGDGVPQVRLEATGEGGAAFATLGEDDGSFRLEVDPGRYDLLVATPEFSLLPWVPLLGLSVFRDATEEVVVPYGAPVRGRLVRAPEPGAEEVPPPVGGAVVYAYAEVAATGGSARLVRVGRAVADEQGGFTLMVPRLPAVPVR